jgi:hypothetical protein
VVVVLHFLYYYWIENMNQLVYQWHRFFYDDWVLVNEVDLNDDAVVDVRVKHRPVVEKLNQLRHLLLNLVD